jgi:hypothetical protein
MFILELCVKKIGVLVFNLGDGFYILDFIKNGLTKPATINCHWNIGFIAIGRPKKSV